VTLYYYEPSGPGYVTVLGRAVVVGDPAEKAKRWKEDWAAYYKDKNRGDDYVLIRVTPFRLEIVSYGHGLLNDPRRGAPSRSRSPSPGGEWRHGPDAFARERREIAG